MPAAAQPFLEALRQWQGRGLLPTAWDSAQLRALDAAIKRRAVFSARNTLEGVLADLQRTVESILNPVQVIREGAVQTVTEGFNPATAREALRESLRAAGYRPGEDIEDTIKDLSSDGRLNLVVKTNVETAQGAGAFVRQNNDPDVVDLFPALELVRYEEREHPRSWGRPEGKDNSLMAGFSTRWMQAAQIADDPAAARVLEETGRMIALKSSGIWQALGDFEDGLGNPYPPFAFNSGMWTEDVDRATAEELGLLAAGEPARPAPLDVASLFPNLEAA